MLLVEDSPADARLLREALRDAGEADAFDMSAAATLGDALKALSQAPPDVVLLDLGLPDSDRDETYARLHAAAPEIPVVALSGSDDVSVAAQTVRQGAQDYLVKGSADGALIARSLRYAIARRAAQRERELRVAAEARRAAAEAALQAALREHERETEAVGRLAANTAPTITAEAFGIVPLRQALPEIFEELVRAYAAALDRALERRAFRTEPGAEDALHRLAERLGFLRTGPRDAVELHLEALRRQSRDATPQRTRAYIEEGRVALLELMGHLAAYYRRPRVT
ncbi:MAG TPA: response regulator [Chloroflexota bacterium]|nr:response regulator [Chloroflexota bacterium]